MATNFSASLTQASDEANEMYCEECERHGDGHVTAVAFCVECVEYKCATCQKYHKRQFQNHKIQDSDHMPQDFYFEKCSAHPKQLIKFYCSECIKEACKECKDNEHVNCSDVNHLPTLASDIQKSEEFKNLRKDMDHLLEDIKDSEKLLKAKSEVIDKQEERATEKFKEHRENLISSYKQQHKDLIENFEKKMDETIATLKTEKEELVQKLSGKKEKFDERIRKAWTDIKEEAVNINTNFKSLKSEHMNLVENFKTFSDEIEQVQRVGQNCRLLIKSKSAKQLFESLQQSIRQIHHTFIQRYQIMTSDIKPIMQSLENKTTFFSLEKVHASAIDRRLAFQFDIDSHSEDIKFLLVLSENILLVSNSKKCSLVIYSLGKSDAKRMNEIKFNKQPCGLTKVSDYKVAVTFPEERKIKLITVSEEYTVLDTTEISGSDVCYGIVYSNNQLIVSYLFPGSVKILSMAGVIEITFDKDKSGQNLFASPLHLTVSPDSTKIYVADRHRHTVTCLTFDGQVKAIYKDDYQLKGPCQLTVDEYGSVYVCGRESNNIHQLSYDLTKVKILLDEKQDINKPETIAYCENNMRLLVGMNGQKIKVFNVLLE